VASANAWVKGIKAIAKPQSQEDGSNIPNGSQMKFLNGSWTRYNRAPGMTDDR